MSDIDVYDDIFGEDTPEVKTNAFAQIKATAEQQEQAEVTVEKAEDELRLAKKELTRIAEKIFPELLNSLEMTEDITIDGIRVQLAEKLRGSIPVANKVEAFKWLNEEGHGHIIKRQIVIEFGKDEEKWAEKFMRDCRQRKKQLNMTVTRAVHHITLKAWCQEMLDDGEDIPLELLGVFLQIFTKVSRTKQEETPF